MVERIEQPLRWKEVLCNTADDIRSVPAAFDDVIVRRSEFEQALTFTRDGRPMLRDHLYFPPGQEESCRHYVPISERDGEPHEDQADRPSQCRIVLDWLRSLIRDAF